MEIETSIEVDTQPSEVWETLTSFESYEEWNPYLTVLRGTAGEEVAVEFQVTPTMRNERTETGKITVFEEKSRLQIESVGLSRWIYARTHTIELEKLEQNQSLIKNRVSYRGILAPLVAGEDIEADLGAMNQALREYIMRPQQ